MDNLVAFILSHGRPDNVCTYRTLKRCGYTGRIIFIVDNLDPTVERYKENFEEVIVFDKKQIAQEFDTADNFTDMRTIVYARNACFKIARELGIKYFIQLDDDYTNFHYRFDENYRYSKKSIRNIDRVFQAMLEFFKSTNSLSIAMSQGGDFIGGSEGTLAKSIDMKKRKCMNSFICDADRPFTFVGRINEDVNTYVTLGSRGKLFFTNFFVSLEQRTTQKASGGMTDVYKDSGTYVKSFYSVMMHPSSVVVQFQHNMGRLHHRIIWDHTVPKILSEDTRKGERKL